MKGINYTASLHTDKLNLLNISGEIGVVSRDGNPLSQTMLECWITWLV